MRPAVKLIQETFKKFRLQLTYQAVIRIINNLYKNLSVQKR